MKNTATQPAIELGLTLSSLEVSDLFFNFVPEQTGTTREAIHEQAEAFADLIGQGKNTEYIDTLTQNFLDRV